MTAKRQDITIEQGADYDHPFFLADDAGEVDNLAGVTFVMQIRGSYGDPTALLTLSTADGSLDVDVDSGTVRPVIGYGVTAAFLPGEYVYDLKSLETNGRIRRRRQGIVTVSPQVTTIPVPAPAPAPSPNPSPAPSPSPSPSGQYDFSSADNSAYAAII